jgi:ferredoxin
MLGVTQEVTMKARIIPEECIACGLCTDVCPRVFRFEGAEVVASDQAVPVEDEEAVREAAFGCPVEAIELEE